MPAFTFSRSSVRVSRTTRTTKTEQKPSPHASVSGKILEWLLYTVIFIAPLFVLPFTSSILPVSAQTFLFTSAPLLLIVYLADGFLSRKLEFKDHVVWYGIGALFVSMLLSALFSSYQYAAFVGNGLQAYTSVSSIFAMLVILFVAAQVFDKQRYLRSLIALTLSSLFVSLFGLLHFFGIHILPWEFTQNASFYLVGPFSTFTLWSAGSLLLSVFLLVYLGWTERALWWQYLGLGLISLSHLAVVLIADDWRIWTVLLSGIIFFLAFLFYKLPAGKKVHLLVAPFFVAIVSFVFLFISLPVSLDSPIEALPSLKTSYSIAWKTMQDAPLLGYGPGRFDESYTRFRPQDINEYNVFNLWMQRFEVSRSAIATHLAATGFVGAAALLLLLVLAFYSFGKPLLSRTLDDSSFLYLAGLSVTFGLLVARFVFPLNSLLLLFFIVCIAGVISLSSKKSRVAPLGSSHPVFISIFVLIVLGGAATWYGTYRLAAADSSYAAAQNYDQQITERRLNGENLTQEDVGTLVSHLESAVKLAPYHDTYLRTLSQGYLFQLSTMKVSDPEFEVLASRSIDAAKLAVMLHEGNSENTRVLAGVYQALSSFTEGADKLVVENYQKAIESDPSNPMLHYELGTYYLSVASMITPTEDGNTSEQDAFIEKGENEMEKALDLKADFAGAYYQLALISMHRNQNEEALERLALAQRNALILTQQGAGDPQLFFLIGRSFERLSEPAAARESYSFAITLDPNYFDARFALAQLALSTNNTDEARTLLEQLLEDYPGDPQVQSVLDRLQ